MHNIRMWVLSFILFILHISHEDLICEIHAWGFVIFLKILNSLDHEFKGNKSADNKKMIFIFFVFFTYLMLFVRIYYKELHILRFTIYMTILNMSSTGGPKKL